jgi:cbb3-type cytochrome oxidase subunit 3
MAGSKVWGIASLVCLILFTVFAIWWMYLVQKQAAKEEINTTYKMASAICSGVLGIASIAVMNRYFKALSKQDNDAALAIGEPDEIEPGN